MMKRIVMITVIGLSMGMNSFVWSYDVKMAESYANIFSQASGSDAGKALHFISPGAFIENIREGKSFVAIDVRTSAETSVFSLSLPNSLNIPVDKIFEAKNLDLIPTDRPVIIVCKSGARATAVGTSLRHIGFDNVYILKGGFQGLSSFYGPKQAYEKTVSARK
jgi:rhodanese-related sulfurtransferase